MHTSHISIKEWGSLARKNETRMKRTKDKARAINAGSADYVDGLYLEEEVLADICFSQEQAYDECYCGQEVTVE